MSPCFVLALSIVSAGGLLLFVVFAWLAGRWSSPRVRERFAATRKRRHAAVREAQEAARLRTGEESPGVLRRSPHLNRVHTRADPIARVVAVAFAFVLGWGWWQWLGALSLVVATLLALLVAAHVLRPAAPRGPPREGEARPPG